MRWCTAEPSLLIIGEQTEGQSQTPSRRLAVEQQLRATSSPWRSTSPVGSRWLPCVVGAIAAEGCLPSGAAISRQILGLILGLPHELGQ